MAPLPTDPREMRKVLGLMGEAHAFCVALAEGIPSMLHRIPSREALSEAQKTVHLLCERAAVWMRSLTSLTRYTDYQAHSAACRALFELAVDVTLIVSEPALVERMWAWEESAKLKSCNRYVAYVRRTNLANPNSTKMGFPQRNEAVVKELRRQHWGHDRHPPTWFGVPFEQVVAEADRRARSSTSTSEAWSSYEETYAKNYDELCWGTHGSSLAMIRQPVSADYIAAIALHAMGESSRLGLELAARAAAFLGLDGTSIFRELFENMQAMREEFCRKFSAESGPSDLEGAAPQSAGVQDG
ncbi:MAG TPA: hypothetical protein VNG33_17345 [Polyangiaceae bacterium]|nr:hypothetical protein [Polyangiaceae bacterium]